MAPSLPGRLVQVAVLLGVCAVAVRAQGPLVDMTPPGVGVVKSDLPLIKCEVCRMLTRQLLKLVQEKKAKATPSKPFGELQVIEITEKVCDKRKAEGTWILHTDMEEEGDRIKLVEYSFEGECLSECRTIQKSCEDTMGYHDTDVAELLLKPGLTQPQLELFLCHDISDACRTPPPPLPKDRKPGEKFEKKTEKKIDYSQMAKEMGVKESVMHDEGSYKLPQGVPQMPAPKDFSKEKVKKVKEKRKGSKKSSKGDKGRKEGEGSEGAGEAASGADKTEL